VHREQVAAGAAAAGGEGDWEDEAECHLSGGEEQQQQQQRRRRRRRHQQQQQQQQDQDQQNLAAATAAARELDLAVLELDIISVLLNKEQLKLSPDEKCFRYFKAIERYLYKRDPSLKLDQFNFEEQEDECTGGLTHVFVPRTSGTVLKKYIKRYIPALVGPVVGAVLSSLWKGV
jgi:hypothetical protein